MPSPAEESGEEPPWLSSLTKYKEENDPPQALHFYRPQGGTTNSPSLPSSLEGDRRPILVSLAPISGDARDAIPQLESIFDANRRTIVLLKPLGLIGEDPAIQELLGWTKLAGLRLTPLRDLSPFLGYSRMAVIYPADDLDVPDLLKRIRRLFNGNFDFLTLAQQAFSLSQTNALLDARLKTLDAQFKALSEREQAVAMHAHAIETRLTSITSGTSWALMQKMMWLRLKLFPRDSFRERVGRFVMQRQRSLRRGLHSLRSSRLMYRASNV